MNELPLRKPCLVLLLLAVTAASATVTPRGESTGCASFPCRIYDSGQWEWEIDQPEIYGSYEAHEPDIDAFLTFPDMVSGWLTSNLGAPERMPAKCKLKLIEPGGGYASGAEIGIAIDAFWNIVNNVTGYWAYVLIAHETVNLYTGNTVSGGWPTDWWADGRSPYPLATAVVLLKDLNWRDSAIVADIYYNVFKQDPLVVMFHDKLYGGYGSSMFRVAFEAMRTDGINWDQIGGLPSALRTNYVAAYLMIGAGNADLSLTAIMQGNVPSFDRETTVAIKASRTELQVIPRNDTRWGSYLHGDYGGIYSHPNQTITIQVETDSTFYMLGSDVIIKITITNQGSDNATIDWMTTCLPNFVILDPSSNPVFELSRHQICDQMLTSLELTPSETRTYLFVWNQVDDAGVRVEPNQYTLWTSVGLRLADNISTLQISTPTPPPSPSIPGFPVEATIVGLIVGVMAIMLLRRKTTRKRSEY